jgi:predicted ester cyclase
MGIPPTHRELAYEHIHILRFEDGRAVEHWGVHDHLSFMQQLGAMRARADAAVR